MKKILILYIYIYTYLYVQEEIHSRLLTVRLEFRNWENIDFTFDFGKYMFEIYLCACIIYWILKSGKTLRAFKKLTSNCLNIEVIIGYLF